jgi:hypothetical protein
VKLDKQTLAFTRRMEAGRARRAASARLELEANSWMIGARPIERQSTAAPSECANCARPLLAARVEVTYRADKGREWREHVCRPCWNADVSFEFRASNRELGP